MVVVCPECGTKFSLDESRISGATAKVRCSRCRHVFRITREGQVVAADWTPPEEIPPVPPPPTEIGAEVQAPSLPESTKPEPASAGKTVQTDEGLARSAPGGGEVEAPPEKGLPWMWLAALLLAVVIVGLLGWRAWQGTLPRPFKPLADVVQRLKKKVQQPQQPVPAPGQGSGAPAPSPTVVTPPPLPVPAADLKDLPVDWAQARYQGLVNSKGGGQLLMIQGEVMNIGQTSRGPIRLKAILTDSQHQPLLEEVVYAGSTFSDTEVRTLKPDEIKGWLAKPGGRSQRGVLKPGDKQPFTVVFFGVPDNLAETQSGFQIVVVDGPVVPE